MTRSGTVSRVLRTSVVCTNMLAFQRKSEPFYSVVVLKKKNDITCCSCTRDILLLAYLITWYLIVDISDIPHPTIALSAPRLAVARTCRLNVPVFVQFLLHCYYNNILFRVRGCVVTVSEDFGSVLSSAVPVYVTVTCISGVIYQVRGEACAWQV